MPGRLPEPIRSELTGNLLTAVGRVPKGNQRTHWVAIWRTPRGNMIHQTTPFTTEQPEQDAIDYALACPESWAGGTVRR